jgi:diguanylate cyclase (GGDEF)-like protein/PAS domain S-box-containing protein
MRTHVATKIAFGLAFLIMGVVFLAGGIRLIPDEVASINQNRAALCELFSVQCASAITRDDFGTIEDITTAVHERNKDLLSVGVRTADGKLVAQAGPHKESWGDGQPVSTMVRVHVPIFLKGRQWGTVEFCFTPPGGNPVNALLFSPQMRLVYFVSLVSLLGFMFLLRRVLQHLDPSTVIPDRVKALLDTLAEGILVLDNRDRIVVANNAFTRAVGLDVAVLLGRSIDRIPWQFPTGEQSPAEFPWKTAARSGKPQRGVPLMLECKATGQHIFSVSVSPITGDGRSPRGVLISLDDVTVLHDRNSELVKMVKELESAQSLVREQNAQLSVMASRDPLTGCLNRRAFFERVESAWEDSHRYQHPLSTIMVDIDHFKSVNDNHGHAMGDHVLQRVAQALTNTARKGDLVCRYGGEEFCVLLPHTDMEHAHQAAQRIRAAVEALQIGSLRVTASLGVASKGPDTGNLESLVEHADNALYAAKRAGRNRVVRADRITLESAHPQPRRNPDQEAPAASSNSIPYHAVTALMAALQQRDLATAAHSRRVADLCVLVGGSLLDARACMVLEVAALLHDIGKIGVPDAILLKPGPLTSEEFEIMDRHGHIGVNIIESAFKSPELTHIVRTHHAFYACNPRQPGLPSGQAIPLRARLLSIADAYDAMVSDRVYRKSLGQANAFAELRRCAGTQFDPNLVEWFISVVQAHDNQRPIDALPPGYERWIQLSIEVEHLASAFDARDLESLSATAQHLREFAAKMEIPQIAELAAQLRNAADVDRDLSKMLQTTTELLHLCHDAQRKIVAAPIEQGR